MGDLVQYLGRAVVVEPLGVHGLGYLAQRPQSGIAWVLPTSSTFRRGWTRRSRFVKVPSFSAKVTDGSTTSADWARSERNVSCTTRNSSCPAACAGVSKLAVGEVGAVAHDEHGLYAPIRGGLEDIVDSKA